MEHHVCPSFCDGSAAAVESLHLLIHWGLFLRINSQLIQLTIFIHFSVYSFDIKHVHTAVVNYCHSSTSRTVSSAQTEASEATVLMLSLCQLQKTIAHLSVTG